MSRDSSITVTLDADLAPTEAVAACVALGSNVGNRAEHLEYACEAIRRLPGVQSMRTSSVHETDPVGPPGQGPYLNAVVEIFTTHSPRKLLEALLQIESERGRNRAKEIRFGPRTLDLDILTWGCATPGGAQIDAPGITIPHPRMKDRPFVLIPLAELRADLVRQIAAGCIHFPSSTETRPAP